MDFLRYGPAFYNRHLKIKRRIGRFIDEATVVILIAGATPHLICPGRIIHKRVAITLA